MTVLNLGVFTGCPSLGNNQHHSDLPCWNCTSCWVISYCSTKGETSVWLTGCPLWMLRKKRTASFLGGKSAFSNHLFSIQAANLQLQRVAQLPAVLSILYISVRFNLIFINLWNIFFSQLFLWVKNKINFLMIIWLR